MSPITKFLEGHPNTKGLTISEILKWDNEKLEETHDYIQWLFPLCEPSQMVDDTPHIQSEDEIEYIKNSNEAQKNLDKSFYRMYDFYKNTNHWLEEDDHNHFRITRILKAMNLLSRESTSEFYSFILEKLRVNNNPVTAETLRFWRQATIKTFPEYTLICISEFIARTQREEGEDTSNYKVFMLTKEMSFSALVELFERLGKYKNPQAWTDVTIQTIFNENIPNLNRDNDKYFLAKTESDVNTICSVRYLDNSGEWVKEDESDAFTFPRGSRFLIKGEMQTKLK